MKKFLCLIMVLIFTLSLASFSASANTLILQSIEEISISGTTLLVNVKLESAVNSAGYCAVYSEDNILKGSDTKDINGTDAEYEIENYTYQSGDYVKTFAWDDNYAPVAMFAEKKVSSAETIEGIILKTYLSNPYYVKGDDTATILVTRSSLESYEVGKTYSLSISPEDAISYVGYSVTATVENNALCSVSPVAGMNNLVTINTNVIVNLDESSIIYYETPTSKYRTEAEIHTSVVANSITTNTSDNFVVINGFNANYDYTSEFFDYCYELDEITLLDNDNDGAFEFIYATVPTSDAVEFVVNTVEVFDGIYAFEADDTSLELDTADPDLYIMVVKDGEITTPDSIVKGDVITLLDQYVSVYTIYASSSRIEGVIDEVDGDMHYINDIGYKISPVSYTNSFRAGTEGIFYLNAFGKIAHIELPPLDYEYFYITDTAVDEGSFNSDIYLVKGVTASGEEAVYTIKSRGVDIYTPDGDATDIAGDDAYEFVREYRGIVKIVLDANSNIYTIAFPDSFDDFLTFDRYEDDAENKVYTYNEKRKSYGIINLSDDTLIFNVDTVNDTVIATTVGKAFIQGLSYSFISYGAEEEIAPVLVAYDLETDMDEIEPVIGESEYVYLIDYDTAVDSFGEDAYYVQLMRDSGSVKPWKIASKKVNIHTKDGTTSSLTAQDAYSIVSEYKGVAKIAFNNYDEIAVFYLPGCDEIVENTTYSSSAATYSKTDCTIGKTQLDKYAMVFNIDTTEQDLDCALSAHLVSKVLTDGSKYSVTSYSKKGGNAEIILVKDLKLAFNSEESVMVVTRVSRVTVDKPDGTYFDTYKITGIKDGTTQAVIVNPEFTSGVIVNSGTVILYSIEDGYATDIQLLFNSDSDAPGTLSENLKGILTNEFTDQGVTIHYGEITEKKSKYIILDDEYKYYFADEVNVTVVDYTGTKVSIAAGTLSSVKASSTKFKKTAFVKTSYDCEDEITDIVVFNTAS